MDFCSTLRLHSVELITYHVLRSDTRYDYSRYVPTVLKCWSQFYKTFIPNEHMYIVRIEDIILS